MELDELKKSWNALDAQLQKEPIADEKQVQKCFGLQDVSRQSFDGWRELLFWNKHPAMAGFRPLDFSAGSRHGLDFLPVIYTV